MRPYLQATKRRAAAIGGIQRRSAAISGWSYGVSLARAIASSSVSNFVTARTGPKISSREIVIDGLTSANSVGRQ